MSWPEPRVVAFVDILGFREIFARRARGEDDEVNEKFYLELKNVFEGVFWPEQVRRDFLESQFEDDGVEPVEATYFSDNIVISISRAASGAEMRIIRRCRNVYLGLLENGFPARGGVAYGVTHHKESMVFGEGIMRAYDLESKLANYPRIIVERAIRRELMKHRHGSSEPFPLLEGWSGLPYIDMFGGLGGDDIERLRNCRKVVGEGLWRALSGDRPDIVEKWLWLRRSINGEIRRMVLLRRGEFGMIPAKGLEPE